MVELEKSHDMQCDLKCEFLGIFKNCIHKCNFFFFYQWPLMSPTITADKRPQSDHRKTPDCSSFSPFCLPLSMIFEQRPWSPADSAQQQIDISGIDIYCSGPRNHFHFTLCCTGKIRHLRYPANQMSFNRTLSLTFTTVYPTNFS